jgi:predicted enzyme related to lactoylglutathione lyase
MPHIDVHAPGTFCRVEPATTDQDADQPAARAIELGGRLPEGVFDVFTNGRMEVVIDPTGAAFCLPYFMTADQVTVDQVTVDQVTVDQVTVDQVTVDQSMRFAVLADPQGAVFALVQA